MIDNIVANLKSFFQSANKQKAVVGLSGGVDSSLVTKIAVIALGNGNVTALILPNLDINQTESVKDAESWAKELGIKYHIIPINDCLKSFDKMPWKATEMADMNSQARARTCILYHFANSNDALVLGTGNKTELTLGYFTKYGDGACDILPIGSLYKTDVWEAAKELGLPDKIINKTPSAGLAPGQTDEGEIGVSYKEMDEILKKFEQGEKPSSENEKKLWGWIQANKHKGEMPPII
jgi:NAD+ synthase